MPINNTYPLATVLEACRRFVQASPSATQRITFEYVMLRDLNDNVDLHVPQLAALISGLPAHVNLM